MKTRILALSLLLGCASTAPAPVAPTAAPEQKVPAVAPAPAASQDTGPSAVPGMAAVAGNANLLQSGMPEVAPDLAARVLRYQNARGAGLLDVRPDASEVLIATRFAETAQLHLVDRPMGARTQITFDEEPIAAARFVPGDPHSMLYLRDVGGGEFHQVYRYDRRAGEAELLTDGKSRHTGLLVSRDGRRFAYSGTGRNGKDSDVYMADLAAPRQARRVVEESGTFEPVDFSPDGTKLLVRQYRSIEDADLHVVDVATGARTQITPKDGKGGVAAASFSADGRHVFLATDRYGDFFELVRIDLAPAKADAVPERLAPDLKWDVEGIGVAPDGKRLALVVNEEGYGRIYLMDLRRRKLEPVDIPRGIVTGLRFPERKPGTLFFAQMTAATPADVFALDLRSRKVTPWTRSELGAVDGSKFVEPELVRYPSTDGTSVPAFLYRPRGAPGRVPVVVSWHGGPEAQARPTFAPQVQMWVAELGVAVLVPNVRGSAGYGKSYVAADNGVLRERSLSDIGATLDFIASRTELDATRVAAVGGSYGGYMTLATAAFFPDRVRAAVDIVGISSLATFLENTQAYRRDLRRAEYGDERVADVRAVQDRISPLYSVDRITAALFVQQGKNDPRVPQSEAEQIVKAVRAKGRPVWYLLALNEGHGFQKKENRDYGTLATALFLREHLAGPSQ